MLKRMLQTSLLTLAVAFTLSFTPASASAQEIYVADSITSFTSISGNSTTLQQIRQKLQQGFWVLYPNGQFVFNTIPDAQAGVPHKVGTYRRQGSSASFSGMSGSYISGTQVYGQIVLGSRPTVSMDAVQVGTGAGSAGGGLFGFSSVIQYRVRANLRRIQ